MIRTFLLLAVALCSLGLSATSHADSSQQTFWENLTALCGKAFAGALTGFARPADDSWLSKDVVMHVRECSDDEIRIPLHVGDDRSRTWVLSRHPGGLRLKHDHRHEDGTEDDVTWYGGHTSDAGRSWRQTFPADDFSKALFLAQGLGVSVDNFWSMEIQPEQQHFAYELVRPGRHFRAEFDLSRTVEPPPPPWGHD
ncbi:MAG: hypothetical protein V2J42_09125 [Wenzhouxiangella sp.]|jgi:hypothetical protein|nr:hypothetical protein [Wenzhouxiangella sp.]